MQQDSAIKLDASWQSYLQEEFQKPYMQEIKNFLLAQKAQGKTIYPKGGQIFRALNLTPFEKLKVVILGQDPYHGPLQAEGLSFSVPRGVKVPPSLKNIYKALAIDIGFSIPEHGHLSSWAKQGVLLLNAILTVEEGSAASHRDIGWHNFTDAIIRQISAHQEHVVFMLWGSFAQSKIPLIDQSKHLVLRSVHPSPLSAHRGCLNCKHFSKANDYLQKHHQLAINWQID